MQYHFFIDESWDHSLININYDFPYFILCGILISEDNNTKLIQQFSALKEKFFGTSQVILHSRDIRKCEWHFSKLFDLQIKESFYHELNTIITNLDFTIIANVVKKENYLKRYGKSAINPYHISLSYILERVTFCADEKNASGVHIYAEMRWKREDRLLLDHYNSIRDNGTYYVDHVRFKKTINDFDFRAKHNNDCGIQLADLCAYPLVKYIRDGDGKYPAFIIIKPKIYINPKTWNTSGLKVIP